MHERGLRRARARLALRAAAGRRPSCSTRRSRALPGSGYRGANVTIPHKLAALRARRRGDRRGRARSARPTRSRFDGDGAIAADNTDAGGCIDALGPARPGARARARRGRRGPRGGLGAARGGRGRGRRLEPHARARRGARRRARRERAERRGRRPRPTCSSTRPRSGSPAATSGGARGARACSSSRRRPWSTSSTGPSPTPVVRWAARRGAPRGRRPRGARPPGRAQLRALDGPGGAARGDAQGRGAKI